MTFLLRIIDWLSYWRHLAGLKRSGKLQDYTIPRLNLKKGTVTVKLMPVKPADYITINIVVR